MIEAALMLYGPYRNHPWQEDMFMRPDRIQRALGELGFGFDVAMAAHEPTGWDVIPEVRIARNPVYDQSTGMLLEADFRPGSIEEYPTIIDHWVSNFQVDVRQPDGTIERTANGIGLPASQLWNHRRIQMFGNRKDMMDEVLARGGVSIGTWPVTQYEKLFEEHGDTEVIYKMQGGSRGQNVKVFPDILALRTALRDGHVAPNGFIQPYMPVNNPIEGLTPATAIDARLLEKGNARADRVREIRMHVVTTTDEHGNLQTEAYPTLTVSRQGTKVMKVATYIGLDPDCIGPGSFIHDKSVELAQAVCHAAGEPDEPVAQYYGVFDWLVPTGDLSKEGGPVVGDGNCRGPHLPVQSEAARTALQRALVSSGVQNIARLGGQ